MKGLVTQVNVPTVEGANTHKLNGDNTIDRLGD